MKVIIASEYTELKDDLAKMVNYELPVLKTFCNNRNTVELFEAGGRKFVMKRYRKPIFVNRIVYTFFRKTKARRAYEHAEMLLAAGINTPRPVAYYEHKAGGLFRDGYFISEYSTLPILEREFYWNGKFTTDLAERDIVCRDLSMFSLKLHQAGFQPLDMNTSNILFEKRGDHYEFALIDINRMRRFKRISHRKAMETFYQIGTYSMDYERLLQPYAEATNTDIEELIFDLIKLRFKKRRMKKLKNWFKALMKRS